MSFVLSIFREVNDPRDMNARHDLAELLFLSLAATLCGAKSCVEIAEFAHGRQEIRRTSLLPLTKLEAVPEFPGLKAIGRIEASRTTADGITTTGTRYVALSKVLSPERLAQTVRAHWTVENQLHWCLRRGLPRR